MREDRGFPMFGMLDERHVERAAQAIAGARRGGYEPGDRADLVAAGAALSLGGGSPRMMAESHDTKADRYLDAGTLPWRKLQIGMARYMQMGVDPGGDAVRLVVADVAQQVSAMKIVAAVGNSGFEQGLNDAQRSLVVRAREDAAFRRQMASIKSGDYHELTEEMSGAVSDALMMPLSPSLEASVIAGTKAVASIVSREADPGRRIAEERAIVEAIPSKEHLDAVLSFHGEGRSTGSANMDAALGILAERGEGMDFGDMDQSMHMAQARMLSKANSLPEVAPSDLASWAVSDARIMSAAMDQMMSASRPSPELEAICSGRYVDLPSQKARSISSTIVASMMTPAMERVSMEMAAARHLQAGMEASRQTRRQDPSMIAAMQNQFGR